MSNQSAIPCLFMRGGTSRGPFFNGRDLPAEIALRDRVLLAVMGSPGHRQIDGLGGGDTLTSKVAIVTKSTRAGIDLDYLFAQVDVNRAFVDTAPSCGNMLSAVAPFGLETGLVTAHSPRTSVMIYNVNTGARIEAIVETPDGQLTYEGGASIDGVPGTGAPIILNFMDVIGSLTGALLPTGQAQEIIGGLTVTCIDVAMPMILLRASDLGLRGDESKTEIDANKGLFAKLEPIRIEAGLRMGLGDVSGKVVPKIGLLSPARDGGTITSRYLTPHALHAAHAVTGAVCIASACVIEGTIAHQLASPEAANPRTIWIEHPSGKVDVILETNGAGQTLKIIAGTMRTARLIMRGEVYVPARIYAG